MVAEEFTVKLKYIKRYKNNNKVHTEANVDQIAKSIEQFGYLSRIGVDENYELLYGEGRFLALQKLGWEEAPVHIIKHLTEAQKKEFRILDNKISDLSFYDTTAIQNELSWLTNNDYEGMLDDIMGDVNESQISSFEDLNTAIEEAQGEFMDKFKSESIPAKEFKQFTRMDFKSGDSVQFRSVNIVFGDLSVDNKGFVFTNDSTVANSSRNGVFICDDFVSAYDDCHDEIIVWHKGTISEEGELVQNNCLKLVRIKGGPLEKRRYNNLITAIPNKETPNNPPASFFEDIMQNFLKPGTKCVSDVYSNIAVAGSVAGYPVVYYCKDSDKINDTLFEIRNYLGLKQMEIKLNGEAVTL